MTGNISTASGTTSGDNLTSTTRTNTSAVFQSTNTINNDEWEDSYDTVNKSTSSISKKGTSGTTELLDMRALQQKRREQDDVAERLRVEETRAVLQRAKLGMEREAKRLEEERAAAAAKKVSTNRFLSSTTTTSPQAPTAAAASATTSGGDKWIPPNKRGLATTTTNVSSNLGRMSTGTSEQSKGFSFMRKLDVGDEEAFPDLASADKLILEAKEKAAAAAHHHRLPTTSKKVTSGTTVSTSNEVTASSQEEKKDGISATPTPTTITPSTNAKESETPSSTKHEVDPQIPPKKDEETISNTEITNTTYQENETNEKASTSVPATVTETTKAATEEVGLLKKKKKKKDISSFKVGG